MVGICDFSLKSVLKSEALHLDVDLKVKDRTQGDLNDSSSNKKWPNLGKLKVCMTWPKNKGRGIKHIKKYAWLFFVVKPLNSIYIIYSGYS